MKKRHLKFMLKVARAQRDEASGRLDPLLKRLRRQRDTIGKYYDVIQVRNKTIDWLRRRLRNQDNTIGLMQPRLERTRHTVGEYYDIIQARNGEIEQHRTILKDLRCRMAEGCNCRYCATVKEILGDV